MSVYGKQFWENSRLLRQRTELKSKLDLLPYDGSLDIKEDKSGKYLYFRKRELGRLTSTYVDKFSENRYQALLRYSKEARELRKQIRFINKNLTNLWYSTSELSFKFLMI